MSDFFFPRLEAVEALAPWRLCTRWSTGEVLEVDVEGVLRATPPLSAILEPAELVSDGLVGRPEAREAVADERRLFHVACSRASRRLCRRRRSTTWSLSCGR